MQGPVCWSGCQHIAEPIRPAFDHSITMMVHAQPRFHEPGRPEAGLSPASVQAHHIRGMIEAEVRGPGHPRRVSASRACLGLQRVRGKRLLAGAARRVLMVLDGSALLVVEEPPPGDVRPSRHLEQHQRHQDTGSHHRTRDEPCHR